MSKVLEVTNNGTALLEQALRELGTFRKKALAEIILDGERAVKERFVPVEDGVLQGSIAGTVDADGMGATLATTGIAYAAAQETRFDFHHPDTGPTGERGADYMGRGIRHCEEIGGAIILKRHKELFGG